MKTALEILIEKIDKEIAFPVTFNSEMSNEIRRYLYKCRKEAIKLLQTEKAQIEDAFKTGVIEGMQDTERKSEDYYYETFKKD